MHLRAVASAAPDTSETMADIKCQNVCNIYDVSEHSNNLSDHQLRSTMSQKFLGKPMLLSYAGHHHASSLCGLQAAEMRYVILDA